MAKPKMYGYRNTYTPNSQADRKHRPKQFFREKDRADDWERIELRRWERMCKKGGKA